MEDMLNNEWGVGLFLVATGECIYFSEKFGEMFDSFFCAEEVCWYDVLFFVM
jgi:hypothetical protein